jgi:hypothetical protein
MKPTKEDWFAAASAQDLWAVCSDDSPNYLYANRPTFVATEKCESSLSLFQDLFERAGKTTPARFEGDITNQAFLAAQIGCELAGL